VSLGYDIYSDIGLLFVRGQGVITQRERINAVQCWLHDAQYDQCRDALIDFAGVQSTPKIREVRELVAIFKQQMTAHAPRRIAMVTSRPINFVVASVMERLVRLHGLPFQMKVFMNLGAAWNWLRPGEPPFQVR
jgi:hypothetical protein